MSVAFRAVRRPLALALLAALAAPGYAQQAPAPGEPASEAHTLDQVIVTGTRVSDRTVAESSAPIDIITPEALEATGTVELATALARALPSLNFPRPAITDGTDAVRPAQLRGLAPDQVLVLVNGKRRHTTALINLNGSQGRGSSPVDLNAIPIASIERVEVLRDGASAQYGSDAIAGVVNVVLKGSDHGGSIAARYGQYSAGDGEQYQLSGDAGFKLGENGKLHLAAQGGHQDQTNRARPFQGVVEQRYGDPDIDSGAVSYNGEYSPTDYLTFYSFGSYSKRDVLSNGYFRFAGDPRNIPSIYPNGFLPQIHNVSKDRAAVVGLRGETAGGTQIDFSYNYGHNELSFDIEHTLNRSLGPTSPTEFYAGALEVTQHVLNLDFARPVDFGWQYPVTFAWGAEWRGEEFSQLAGEPLSYANGGVPASNGQIIPGAQVFSGFRASDAGDFDRHSYSLYADVEADLTDKFSAGIAARFESYSDFGDTTSGKLSARYAFTDKVALRATASTGFRAPSLQQQFFQSIATNFISGVPYEIGTFRVDNPAAVALGSESLKAEESTNYSLGLVLQPSDGLYITIDAYHIKVDDRILLSENLTSTAVRNYLQANGYPGIGGGRYFTNAVDTKTQGVDIVATQAWDLASGKFNLTLGYNYSKTEIEKIAPNPARLAAIDPAAVRIGRTEIGRITKGAPKDKFFLAGDWDTGNWSFNATATRYGEFTELHATNPLLDQTFGAKWTLDLAATYHLDSWDFTIGGDNVLDEYPDESKLVLGTRNYLPYNTASPFGFNGAFAYLKVGYKW
ncbi:MULTISPECIES: TonB-dependent receptor [unclassified Lysobacter]|uniref:TonB-dependent receptor plug domain-containing protein n=1 Tax=unclassified Lysobacter TaxID=2635362 RepID=UPI0006F9CD32|nr:MULTISPECIES: TonB-dependent receptor [unclassified Lysobacter]KQZ66549.1 ligand-gated channel [Lysobacter sp. Root559]KRC32701.1 ligand-gated channel [Lysobacter sp. Root76]KRD67955.1 ligand-gated channel [Lysobacter sp. Root96]